KLLTVARATAQQQRDAIVRARHDQARVLWRVNPAKAVVAQSIAQENRIVEASRSRVDFLLHDGAHRRATTIVQTLGQEAEVDRVGRPARRQGEFPHKDIAGNEEQAHGGITSAIGYWSGGKAVTDCR